MDLTGRSKNYVKNGIVEIDFSSYASGVYSILLKANNRQLQKE